MAAKPAAGDPCFSLCLPDAARAHSTIQGLEGFSGGALHPLTTPAHLLVIVALGLLTGQRSPPDLKAPFVIFVPCLTFALIFTTTGLVKSVYQPVLIGLALCAAIPVALEKPLPPWLIAPSPPQRPSLSDSIQRPNRALPAF